MKRAAGRFSVLVAVVVTALCVFLDLAGYALSRLHFKGRGTLFVALLAVLSVPGVVLLVPKFLIVTYLGIFDTKRLWSCPCWSPPLASSS